MAAPSALKESKFRVLIIEDDPYIARLIVNNLEKVNLECRTAGDGIDGMQTFKAFDPHLVLTDIMMPGMDGRSVCQVIREVSMVPIILMTAADTSEAELESFKAGADDYIPKPFDPKLLVARVVAHLRRVYRYDAEAYQPPAETPQPALAAGTAGCKTCGFKGPRDKFKREDAKGQRFLICPQCQESMNIAVG